MKRQYCVCAQLTEEEFETAVARWSVLGMQGVEEIPCKGSVVFAKVYFTDRAAAETAAGILRDTVGAVETVLVEPVIIKDWNARWRESMQPAVLAPSWWVSPDWLPPPLKQEDHWIRIEPKMAFGTGHHATTRLAAGELITNERVVRGGRILDVGTGSGVLCFVAVGLGSIFCCGLEIDPDCRENLSENRDANGLPERTLSFVIGSLGVVKNGMPFDVIAMNMIYTESAPLLPGCRSLLGTGGRLIWTGIVNDEKKEAVAAGNEAGFRLVRESSEEEWWCGLFRK